MSLFNAVLKSFTSVQNDRSLEKGRGLTAILLLKISPFDGFDVILQQQKRTGANNGTQG